MKTEFKKNSLIALFIPIFLETLLLMSTGIADTLMLSSVHNGVGAVGTANSYIGMFFIFLSVVTTGMMAVMTQNIGAKRPGVAYQTRQLAILVNGIIGLIISGLLIGLSEPILKMLCTSEELLPLATVYMRIVAIGSFFDGLTLIFSSYLRAFNHTRSPFVAALSGNILNVALNALFLYAFGWGVEGVAASTAVSKLFILVLMIIFCYRSINNKNYKDRISRKTILIQMFKIGIPAALESISYSIAMGFVMSFINRMDVKGFNATAYAFTTQVTNFAYCTAMALSLANSFIVGWEMGSKEYEKCYKGTIKVTLVGISIAVILELIFALLGRYLGSIMSNDQTMIQTITWLLYIDIGLEIGRATNLVIGKAIKTTGYSLIPSVGSIIINAIIAVTGTYIFGILLGWGVLGAMFAMALDECLRGLFLFFLWLRKKWQKSRVVLQEESLIVPVGE